MNVFKAGPGHFAIKHRVVMSGVHPVASKRGMKTTFNAETAEAAEKTSGGFFRVLAHHSQIFRAGPRAHGATIDVPLGELGDLGGSAIRQAETEVMTTSTRRS